MAHIKVVSSGAISNAFICESKGHRLEKSMVLFFFFFFLSSFLFLIFFLRQANFKLHHLHVEGTLMVTTGIKGFKDSPMVPLKTDGPNSIWLSLPGSTRNKLIFLLPPLSQYLPISKPKDYE